MPTPGETAPGPPPARHTPAGFFALRAALLPFDALVEWGRGLGAASADAASLDPAVARDTEVLRERLQRWVAEPVVRDALYVASPGLAGSLDGWLRAPASDSGQKVERAVVRYLSRMAGRATPFGLFATASLGRLGDRTSAELPPRAAVRTCSRLGLAYVGALVDRLHARPEVRGALRYVPNTTLYAAGDQLRYLEARTADGDTRHFLVSVERQPYLAAVLERARAGATLAELAAALIDAEPEADPDDARAYVDTLVSEQVVVSTWAPVVSGDEPVAQLVEAARGVPALAEVRRVLDDAGDRLRGVDAAGPGRAEGYRAVARQLAAALPVPVDESRLWCVDAFRDGAGLQLPPIVTDEMLRGVDALRRLAAAASDGPLDSFKARFAERYERRAMPLLEAIDDERGIGIGLPRAPGQATGPLLAGFAFPAGGGEPPFEPIHRVLLRRLEPTWRAGARELELTDDDLASAGLAALAPLPDGFGVLATLVAASAAQVDAGQFRVVLKNVHGPHGAVSLARHCHGDPALLAAVRDYLRAEEALDPEVVFAEIVHRPPGHAGNVSCRPRLRRYEIPVAGLSGAPRDDQIALDDLWVSVEAGRIVLRSRRLGREVRPRLGNVDNYAASSVAAYRFLCMLQNEPAIGLRFRWGPLRRAVASLPRVVYGRTVLAIALWNIDATRLAAWSEARGAARFAAVQRFRAEAGLPRWVSVRDDDKHVPVDLDNALAVDVLVRLLAGRGAATPASLEEVYPAPDQLVVRSDGGGHVHELVVPFLREAPAVRDAPRPPRTPEPTGLRRRFPPGSDWLYVKLYAGVTTLDRLLAGGLGDAIDEVVRGGALTRWFFIRYRDPDPHLRLRFHGEPRRLATEVWPVLRERCAAALDADVAWRLALDTYEREVERYGGAAGIELAEDIFCADSDAALAIVRHTPGAAGADLRWRLALRGMDQLLGDLGLAPAEQRDVVERSRASFASELRADERAFRDQLDRRFRRERLALEALLAPSPAAGPAQPAILALDRRTERVRPAGDELRRRERAGELTVPLAALAGSLLHMHANRLLVDDARAQERILHDFLARLHRSRQARLAGARPPRTD